MPKPLFGTTIPSADQVDINPGDETVQDFVDQFCNHMISVRITNSGETVDACHLVDADQCLMFKDEG